MKYQVFAISVLSSPRLLGVLALALLVVAVEVSIGETNGWFSLGLSLLEWINPANPVNPTNQVHLLGEVSCDGTSLLASALNWALEKLG